MDELTMMIQVAGGDPGTVSRLRAAGLSNAKDLCRADVEEVVAGSGLPAAAARRLIKAAQEMLTPVDERRTRSPRNGLAAVTVISPAKPSGPSAAASFADSAATDQGVSKAESAALAGPPCEEVDPRSFWRFG